MYRCPKCLSHNWMPDLDRDWFLCLLCSQSVYAPKGQWPVVKAPPVVRAKAPNEAKRGARPLGDRWSREYERCVRCMLTVSVHGARGVCRRCLDKEKRAKRKAARAA